MKQFKQQLEHILDQFYTIQASINPFIKPLLVPTIEGCVRVFLPGWTTLTWGLLNIDAFLHTVRGSVSSLGGLVRKVNEALEEHIHAPLEEIANNSLFDLNLATSKCWVCMCACVCLYYNYLFVFTWSLCMQK